MAEIVAMKRSEPVGPVGSRLENGVLRLTLANPPANALSLETVAALQAQLDAARDDKAVGVIVLAASGNVFCAGHDLKEMTAHRSDADRGRADSGTEDDSRCRRSAPYRGATGDVGGDDRRDGDCGDMPRAAERHAGDECGDGSTSESAELGRLECV